MEIEMDLHRRTRFLFAICLAAGILTLSDQALAEKCPSIEQMKSRKLPIHWYVAEPEIMNAMEFEKVVIDRKDVVCYYTSIFDKEIAVGLRGKKQPINPFSWLVTRDQGAASCRKGIDSCAFMNYDQESLDMMINIIGESRKKAREEELAKEKEILKEAEEEVPEEMEVPETGSGEKPSSGTGVKIF